MWLNHRKWLFICFLSSYVSVRPFENFSLSLLGLLMTKHDQHKFRWVSEYRRNIIQPNAFKTHRIRDMQGAGSGVIREINWCRPPRANFDLPATATWRQNFGALVQSGCNEPNMNL
ncbi:MAG: hypothetical protein NXY57DRAFT_789398 [Lentinula lateritia]|nr:MAG: hypothetical protein NXY57DRAFT_789398 [Lentinula lateritia]